MVDLLEFIKYLFTVIRDFFLFVRDFILIMARVFGLSPICAAAAVSTVVFSVMIGVIGRISFRFGVWKKQIAAPDEPQPAKTAKTPRQVLQESRAARLKLLGCRVFLLFAVFFVVLIFLVFGDAPS